MKLELYLVWAAATYVAAQRRGDAPKVVDLGYAMHAPLVNVSLRLLLIPPTVCYLESLNGCGGTRASHINFSVVAAPRNTD